MLRVGESALLLQLAGSDQALAAYRRIAFEPATADLREQIEDLVPGATTLLVVVRSEPETIAQRLRAIEAEVRATEGAGPLAASVRTGELDQTTAISSRRHEIPTRYDGADLGEVANRLGIEPQELVRRHSSVTYQVAFLGFQPGFAYLSGLPSDLHFPRRPSPRSAVPEGSLAIGGEWTGIYPAVSPGGWNLLGTVELPGGRKLFSATAEPPALFAPADTVRFLPR